MGQISRPEAEHRLKIASANVNNAITEVRAGRWGAARDAVLEALRLLDHLDFDTRDLARAEAELVGSVSFGAPPGRATFANYTAAPQKKKKKKVHQITHDDACPWRPGASPGTCTCRVKAPPPPRVFSMPEAKTEPPPPPRESVTLPDEPVTFDPANLGDMREAFAALPDHVREKIAARHAETGKPVTIRLRRVPITVKETS